MLRWQVLSAPIFPIRLCISVERKFYNMEYCVDLAAMNFEANAILKKLYMGAASQAPHGLLLQLK